MKMLISALVLVTSSIVAGQRGSFAGTRPIGFPDTPNRTTTTPDPLGNRFGEGIEKLPIEANGDRDLIDRLSKLPIDKQPFWFINWQSYEKHRQDPQTYPQRPNTFVDPIPQNANSGQTSNGFPTPASGFNGTESTGIFNRFDPTTALSQPSNNVGPTGTFNNNAYPNSNVYPTGNPNSNVYPSGNPNSNVYPSGNPNSNVYPSGNPNSNVYPSGNPNSNVYPSGNPNSNVYPTGNPNSNVYPSGNPNSNVYPTGNLNSNVYPSGNPNYNVYPSGNPNSIVYPTGNPNSNVYPTGNANSNVYQTSNVNSNSNSGAITKNGTSFQTTQKYPRTDTYPQRSGHGFF